MRLLVAAAIALTTTALPAHAHALATTRDRIEKRDTGYRCILPAPLAEIA